MSGTLAGRPEVIAFSIYLNKTMHSEQLDFILNNVEGMLYCLRSRVTNVPLWVLKGGKKCFSCNLVLTLRRDFVASKEHSEDGDDGRHHR